MLGMLWSIEGCMERGLSQLSNKKSWESSNMWGLSRLEYLRKTFELKRHFETQSMQQWCPSNLTVDATVSLENIRRTVDPLL